MGEYVRNKLDGLQELRAGAALIVMLQHCLYGGSMLAHFQPPSSAPSAQLACICFSYCRAADGPNFAPRLRSALPCGARDANLSGILGGGSSGVLCCATAGAPWTFEWKAFFLVPSMTVNDSFNIPYWTLIY